MTKKRGLRIELIRSKLADIEERVSLVEANLPPNFEEFSELGLVKDGIYKRMEFAIERIIDILSIINSDLRLSIPEDEEDVIENLGRNGILMQSMVDKVRRMKEFRNIIVHRYGRIDDLLAYKILKENFEDFGEFIESIELFLEESLARTKKLD